MSSINRIPESLDGFESSNSSLNQPDDTRMGQVTAGPDRGRFPQIAHDRGGRLHVVYIDADQGDIRYMRRAQNGQWTQPMVIDGQGYAGHGLRMEIDDSDHLNLVYAAVNLDNQKMKFDMLLDLQQRRFHPILRF